MRFSPFHCFLLSLLVCAATACHTKQESEPPHKRYLIEAEKISPVPFYVNSAGDTIDISRPARAEITLDTSYALSRNAEPVASKEVRLFNKNKRPAKPPAVIPFAGSLFDTLVHGDTMHLEERPLRGKKMKISKSSCKKLDPPAVWDNSDGAIRVLGAGQGLPPAQMSIQLKDKDGNLWFASPMGISKYDGVYLTDYALPSSGSSRRKTLFQDKKGDIWIGLENKIIRYDGNGLTVFDEEAGLENIAFTAREFGEDQKGNIWFSDAAALSCITGTSIIRFPDLYKYRFVSRAMFADAKGNVWMSKLIQEPSPYRTGNYLLRYDGKHILRVKDSIPQVTNASFSCINMDSLGNMWMAGAWNGEATLVKYDGKRFYRYGKEQGFELEGPHSAGIIFTEEGRMIIKCAGGVMIEFDGKYFTRIVANPELADIGKVVEDEAGNLWFTASGSPEIYVYSPNKFSHIGQAQMRELGIDGIHSFMDRSGRVWWKNIKGLQLNRWSMLEGDSLTNITFSRPLGYPFWADSRGGVWDKWGNGLSRYRDGLVETIPAKGSTERIVEDKEGKFWIPTSDHYLHILSERGLVTTRYDQELFDIVTGRNMDGMLVDSRNRFWMSGRLNSNIARFDGTHWAYFRFPSVEGRSLKFHVAIDPVEDGAGNIWFILGRHSLVKYDGKEFCKYSFSLLSEIESFIKDDKGRLWLATANDGIGMFDGRHLHLFTQEQGLLDGQAYSIRKDPENRIWVTSVNGISIIEESEDQNFNIRTLGKADGLNPGFFPLDKGVCFSEKTQTAYFRSLVGMTFLNLEALQKPETPPRGLSLCQVDINQQFIDYGRLIEYESILKESFSEVPAFLNYPKDLSIPYNLNHLTFYFTAHNWEAPHKIRYSFKLKNAGRAWSMPQAEPSIDYRNLPIGNHTLLVRAKNESNIWSEPFEYQFRVRPPWWRTWAAYFAYFLVICALFYRLFLYLQGRLRLQHALELEQQEARRLKELDTLKSRLYTNITHEFRTPLTVIMGMADQIQENPRSYLGEGLHLIKNNGRNLLRLINQILDLSKMEDESFQLKLEQGDIVSYIGYLTESYQTYVNSRNLSLRFSSAIESQVMDYDPEQIKQVMANLLSNAIKFTPSEGHIRVSLSREMGTLLIRVSDTGIGIPEKALPHIFDRFYQVDGSSTRGEQGTGIGLAHTQQLVHLMGGNIRVESQVGLGTTFTVELPITRNSPVADSPEKRLEFEPLAQPKFAEENSAPHPEEERLEERPQLLIIEDNHDVVAYLRSCLADRYNIEVAFNGKIGKEKALEHIPDLIISDVMMPEMDGYQLCDTLKNDERTSHIPIILLTAKADPASRIRGLKRGADAYLSKPFDKAELLVRLEKLVERQQKMREYFMSQFRLFGAQETKEIANDMEEAVIMEHAFIKKAKTIIEKHYQEETFGLPQLCDGLALSRSQLYRKMKALADVSPSDYIRDFRLDKAKELLQDSDLTVSEVAWQTGFGSPSHFSKAFKDAFGFSPKEV